MNNDRTRLLAAAAGGIIAAVGLNYWRLSLGGGAWWRLGDVALGALAQVGVVFAALCLLGCFAPELAQSVRRGRLRLVLLGLAGMMAYRLIFWATSSNGTTQTPAIMPLLLEMLLQVLGWGSALLIAWPLALGMGGARRTSDDAPAHQMSGDCS